MVGGASPEGAVIQHMECQPLQQVGAAGGGVVGGGQCLAGVACSRPSIASTHAIVLLNVKLVLVT